jgi:hypothetical protein
MCLTLCLIFNVPSNIYGCATHLSSNAPRNIWRKVEGRDSSSCHQGAKVQSTQYRVSSCTAATRANPVACLPFPYQYYRYKNYRSKPYFFTKNCPTPRRWGDQNLQPAQHRDTHQLLVKCLIFNFSSNNFGCAARLLSDICTQKYFQKNWRQRLKLPPGGKGSINSLHGF